MIIFLMLSHTPIAEALLLSFAMPFSLLFAESLPPAMLFHSASCRLIDCRALSAAAPLAISR